MLGNTNVKDGVALNASVTEMEVIGNAIVAGDFVEFTGNTTNEYVADINMNYATPFEINSGKAGIAFYNKGATNIRFLVMSDCAVLNDVTVTLPEALCTSSKPFYDMYANFYNGKLYVHGAKKDAVQKNTSQNVFLYVFTFDNSTNSIAYESKITLTLPNDLSASSSSYAYYVDYRHFFVGNIIYVVQAVDISSGSITGNLCINKFDLSGNLLTHRVFDTEYSAGIKATLENNIDIDEEYAYIYSVSGSGSSATYRLYAYSSSDFSYNTRIAIFEYSRGSYGDPNIVIPCSIYVDDSKDILAFATQISAFSTYSYLIRFVAKNENQIKTTVTIPATSAVSNYSSVVIKPFKTVGTKVYLLVVIKCNNDGGTSLIATIEYDYVNYNARLIASSMFTATSVSFGLNNHLPIILLNEKVEMYFAGTYNNPTSSSAISKAYGVVGMINNDIYVPSETIDLVKKYENRIDGVAKQSGVAGDTIEVYVPTV